MVTVVILWMGELQQWAMLFMQFAIRRLELNHTVYVWCRSPFASIMPDGSHETVIRDDSVVSLDRVRLICTLIETCVL